MNLNYTFSQKAKKVTLIMMGIGLLAVIYALVLGIPAQRIWANLLVNIFFFTTIALGATFYMAKKYAAEAMYATAYKRVYEAVSTFLPVGAGLLVVFLLLGQFHVHHIYHWMDKEFYNPENENYVESKATYLNPVFFWGRILVLFGLYVLAQHTLRKRSLEEDLTGNLGIHWKNITTSALFLVLFGFTSPVIAWDIIMSIDTHWYSTMFGWYVFAGFWCTAMIVIMLFTVHLKEKGYLEIVNDSHIHDLGKWIFALSFLWTYTFFCQFMLIWYANIPEEVAYFHDRIDKFGYRPLFWVMFFVNFALPMLFLMSRDAKRDVKWLKTIGVILLCTHWLDVYVMVVPGTVASNFRLFSPFEIGLFIGFAGMFCSWIFRALEKAPLVPLKHPFLEESKQHQI